MAKVRCWVGSWAVNRPGDADSHPPQQLIKAEEETELLSPRLKDSKCPGAGLWATN